MHQHDTSSPLRFQRRARGLTLRELSRAAGVSVGYLSQLEQGQKPSDGMTLRVLRKIASALHTSVGEVAGEPLAAANCDAVYAERDRLVAFLARLYPAHLSAATDAADGWHYVVCVHTPAGQLAWHVPDHEVDMLFRHLEMQPNDWDGHTTDQKYSRLAQLARTGR